MTENIKLAKNYLLSLFDKHTTGLTREYLKSFLDKYTYDPRVNLSARWALLWCNVLLLLGLVHLWVQPIVLISVTSIIDYLFGFIAFALYPTLGAMGTIYRDREENLESQVTKQTKLLREKEEKYRNLFEHVPAGSFGVTEGKIADINGYALDLIKLPRKEVIGQRCLNTICKGEAACKLSNSPGEITTKEITLNSPDGARNFVVVNCWNLEIEGKSSILGSITNINERKKLEETILEHKRKLEAIFDGMDDGILAINGDLKIVAINRKLASILGSSPESLIGKYCAEVIHPTCQEIVKNVFTTGKQERREIVLYDRNGQEIYEDIIYAPIKNKAGEVEQVIEVLRDITEKRRMEELLLRSEKLATTGEVAASVAHEINNPIGIILGFTQRILERTPDGSDDYEELKIVEQECIRCGKIVKDLLDFSRPNIPQMRLLNEPEIKNIITNCFKLLNIKMKKRKISADLKIDDGSMIKFDPHQIQQVLMNILLNSIQAMPNGGVIELSVTTLTNQAEYPNGLTIIVLEDTGEGIPAEDLLRIFDPFFSTKSNGTGLGLSLSKKIVEAHEGRLRAESEFGQGTRIILELPL